MSRGRSARRGPRGAGALLRGATALLIAAVPAILATPQPVAAQPATAQPVTDQAVTAEILTTNGTGCPSPDQVTATVSPDGSYLHVTYESFRAVGGDGVPVTDSRKNCQLELALHHPADVTFLIRRAHYVGTVLLPAGSSGEIRRTLTCGGIPWSDLDRTRMTGPLDGEFRVTVGSTAFIPEEVCSSPVWIHVQLGISVGTAARADRRVLALAAGPDNVSSSYELIWVQRGG